MKAILRTVLCAALVIITAAPLYANSAPSYWKAYPYSEVLAVEEASPIAVEREKLTFDFSAFSKDDSFMSPVAKVTAEYKMSNPSDEPLQVQMAFPLVSRLSELSVPDLEIKADGKAVPFELFVSAEAAKQQGDSGEDFHYGGFDVSKSELELPGLSLDREATLCKYRLVTQEERQLRLEVGFNANPGQTRLVGNNFNSISYTEGAGSVLGAGIFPGGDREAEILILGEECPLDVKVLEEGGREADPGRYSLETDRVKVDPRRYLLDTIYRDLGAETAGAFSDTQLLNLYLNGLWQETLVSGCTTMDDLLSYAAAERIVTLVYTVDFPAGSARTVTVGYLTDGSMDQRETILPKYTYLYLLSPAKNWADFGKLDIEVITPPEAPYLIESSVAFDAAGKNRYLAGLDGLPEEELSFTLYKNEKVTLVDRTQRSVLKLSYLMFFLWPVLVILLILAAAAVVKRLVKRKKTGS